MTEHSSIFSEDWRNCLRAHYIHVIRSGDKVTEPSLKKVLLRVGFSQDEITEIAISAKMRDVDTPPSQLPGLE